MKFKIVKYNKEYSDQIIHFLEVCLPQSGRYLELDGRHDMYRKIETYFEHFWCLFDENNIIGSVAIKRLNSGQCELKSLYLLEQYHGKGLGHELLETAIQKARRDGYTEMYLDTLSSSINAIYLYEKRGFVRTERYNTNSVADVFMVLKLV